MVSITPGLGAGLKKMEYVPMPELDEQQLEHNEFKLYLKN